MTPDIGTIFLFSNCFLVITMWCLQPKRGAARAGPRGSQGARGHRGQGTADAAQFAQTVRARLAGY